MSIDVRVSVVRRGVGMSGNRTHGWPKVPQKNLFVVVHHVRSSVGHILAMWDRLACSYFSSNSPLRQFIDLDGRHALQGNFACYREN